MRSIDDPPNQAGASGPVPPQYRFLPSASGVAHTTTRRVTEMKNTTVIMLFALVMIVIGITGGLGAVFGLAGYFFGIAISGLIVMWSIPFIMD